MLSTWIIISFGVFMIIAAIVNLNLYIKEKEKPTETTVFIANDTKQYLLVIDTHSGDTWLAYKTDDERIFKIEKIYTKDGKNIDWRRVQITADESSVTNP